MTTKTEVHYYHNARCKNVKFVYFAMFLNTEYYNNVQSKYFITTLNSV